MLHISRPLYEQVVAHCRSRLPKEACGLLAGAGLRLHPGIQRVTAAYPMTNVEDSPIGYAMDPREQLSVMRQMRERDQHFLGVYHSHTASPAYPSSVDVTLAVSPDLAYVVISFQDPDRPDFKSFRIDGAAVTPEPASILEA